MDLRGKQKRYLRAQAHKMRPLLSIGKNGLTQEWLTQLGQTLETRELIKVNILQNADVESSAVKDFIETNSPVTVVQTIGRVLVLYLPAEKEDYRKYSVEVEKLG